MQPCTTYPVLPLPCDPCPPSFTSPPPKPPPSQTVLFYGWTGLACDLSINKVVSGNYRQPSPYLGLDCKDHGPSSCAKAQKVQFTTSTVSYSTLPIVGGVATTLFGRKLASKDAAAKKDFTLPAVSLGKGTTYAPAQAMTPDYAACVWSVCVTETTTTTTTTTAPAAAAATEVTVTTVSAPAPVPVPVPVVAPAPVTVTVAPPAAEQPGDDIQVEYPEPAEEPAPEPATAPEPAPALAPAPAPAPEPAAAPVVVPIVAPAATAAAAAAPVAVPVEAPVIGAVGH